MDDDGRPNAGSVLLGGGGPGYAVQQRMALKYANRHGLIAGATGTGKTVSLQILAEAFSAAGTPVILADVKGDLSGLAAPGSPEHKLHPKLVERAGRIGFDDFGYDAFPVVFWDLFGRAGHPLRTTVTEMGPLLLSRLMDLSEAQEGVLNIAFRLADEDGLLLIDLKDLQAMLTHVGERADDLTLRYGNVSKASIGAIQRRLVVLENQGAAALFGEPALKLEDLVAQTPDGRGRINVIAADALMRAPQLYAVLLLWLLSELFESLPEVGDPERPVLAFFFDEAHLLFEDAPKALIDTVEQVARLIRSKGVGVYFVTQSPDDVPEDILGQLGAKVQHALRAFTPRDRKVVRAAAESFRPNPAIDTEAALTEMGVGEALVSVLEVKGAPSVVERTLIRPPSSRIGPLSAEERAAVIAASPLVGLYETAVDRESAFEILRGRAEQAALGEQQAEAEDEDPTLADSPFGRSGGHDWGAGGGGHRWGGEGEGERFNAGRRYRPKAYREKAPKRRGDDVGTAFAKSLARSVGSQLGRRLTRGLMGGLFKGR
ncbi:MAG: helicase HerA-like domain-containing protein [Pseudomonadota bacterium]